MKSPTCVSGLFQGMFEKNTLTFNPAGTPRVAPSTASPMSGRSKERSRRTALSLSLKPTKPRPARQIAWSSILTAIRSSSISMSDKEPPQGRRALGTAKRIVRFCTIDTTLPLLRLHHTFHHATHAYKTKINLCKINYSTAAFYYYLIILICIYLSSGIYENIFRYTYFNQTSPPPYIFYTSVFLTQGRRCLHCGDPAARSQAKRTQQGRPRETARRADDETIISFRADLFAPMAVTTPFQAGGRKHETLTKNCCSLHCHGCADTGGLFRARGNSARAQGQDTHEERLQAGNRVAVEVPPRLVLVVLRQARPPGSLRCRHEGDVPGCSCPRISST